jgi:hypothetical protein
MIHFHTLPRLALITGILLATNPLDAAGRFEPWKTSADPVAKMWEQVSSGRLQIDVSSKKKWVSSVLRALNIPVESQVLVFSKTSLQNSLINPQAPRSVFYNEEAYAGWAQGGMMELIGMDPQMGAQFYTLSYPESKGGQPVLATSDQCLSCHESSRTEDVNGLLVRSVYVDADGQPLLQFGSFLSGHESPIDQRWGGWYVTGRSGKDQHMGNVITTIRDDRPVLDRARGTNVMSLKHFFDTNPYLTNTSDIISLMVLEHQCVMHNKLTAGAMSAREAMVRQHDLQKAFNEPITDVPQGSAQTVIRSHAEKIVQHLLFCEEYTLQDGGVEGSPAFQDAFRKNRKDTTDGHSLKDFQLLNRLFKYRCSYMIYSSSFDALPAQLKNEIYAQLGAVLSGKNQAKDYAHLGESERRHIREILLETKQDLPADWRDKLPSVNDAAPVVKQGAAD